jgi:hypothetical protein
VDTAFAFEKLENKFTAKQQRVQNFTSSSCCWPPLAIFRGQLRPERLRGVGDKGEEEEGGERGEVQAADGGDEAAEDVEKGVGHDEELWGILEKKGCVGVWVVWVSCCWGEEWNDVVQEGVGHHEELWGGIWGERGCECVFCVGCVGVWVKAGRGLGTCDGRVVVIV